MRRLAVILAGAVVITSSCSTDTSTSSGTLTPTTTILPTTTTFAPDSLPTVPAEATAVVPEGTTAAPTTEVAPGTTTPPAPSTELAAAFIGGPEGDHWLPLGYWDGSGWVQTGVATESAPLEFPAAPGDPLRVTGLDLAPAATALGDSGEACFDGRIGFAVGVAPPEAEPPGFGYSAIAVAAAWEIQPRPANQVGLEVDEYRQIGASFADDLGADGTLGEVEQVVRTDLDGDGMEEVLVAFEHYESPFGAPGNVSLVYLRAPQISGTVVDTVIFSSFVEPDLPAEQIPFMHLARVLGVADLNGDGRMEIALRNWYYEGAGVTVFEFGGDGATVVMDNGCGA
jgi:hypothetical protein